MRDSNELIKEVKRQAKRLREDTTLYSVSDLLLEVAEKLSCAAAASEWKDVKENPPTEEGKYIICDSFGYVNVVRFNPKVYDVPVWILRYGVAYWIPVPKLPDCIQEEQ